MARILLAALTNDIACNRNDYYYERVITRKQLFSMTEIIETDVF